MEEKMIDFHTHTILSDGDLLPSELVRRALVNGVKAIAITDHVDHSNIETVLKGIVKVSKELNKYWDIYVMPGVEITHVPLESFPELVKIARSKGALVVVAHGESPVEPVIKGTNRAAIEAGIDILAHPGEISVEDAALAAEKGVYLEITTRRGHCTTNKHVCDTALIAGAKLILDTDAHSPENLLTQELRNKTLCDLTPDETLRNTIIKNSEELLVHIRKRSKKTK